MQCIGLREVSLRDCSGLTYGNLQRVVTYGRRMPMFRIEIAATDQIEAKRIQSVYQRGERIVELDDEATEGAWRSGYTPVGRPVFVGLTNGKPISYRFDVPVETSVIQLRPHSQDNTPS